jgi:hypothetical protein
MRREITERREGLLELANGIIKMILLNRDNLIIENDLNKKL